MASSGYSPDSPKVLIFDWDDTICPSSFVDRYQVEKFSELPTNVQKLFNEIARAAEKCLQEASNYGEVIIITNSDDGWVKYSCERYVPSLLPVMKKYRVVSARTRYERFYPSQPLCWKAAAFAHEVNEVFDSHNADEEEEDWQDANASLTDVSSDSGSSSDEGSSAAAVPTNSGSTVRPSRDIISFGDSMEERTAVRIVAEQLSATPKSVMFIPSPTPTQIIGQLSMVTDHLAFVCTHESSLDLEISPEQAERCATSYLRRHHHKHRHLSGDLLEEMTRKFTEADMESEDDNGSTVW